MRHRSIQPALVLTTLTLAGLALIGCSSGNDSRKQSFRANPTPELVTLTKTADDVDNQLTITNNYNFRMISEDFGRIWLMERPSRLQRGPTPY